ncbi:MAG: fasciclin domain-containing protein [Nocardioides sp.]
MKIRRLIPALTAVVAGIASFAATPANAEEGDSGTGTTSLVEVLGADGTELDNNWHDFDIVEAAAFAVLETKPDSAVGVLAQGDVELTAFVPTDRAFRKLVLDLTGTWVRSEQEAFDAVASLGIDTVEAVLLYHVVPGSAIDYQTAKKADGAVLTTAGGGTIEVAVYRCRIFLQDADPDAFNPRVKRSLADINKGNKQIAHGINRVLRPIDL